MLELRLIPAHAGKTAPHDAGAWRVPAHPRSRGENSLAQTSNSLSWGSSPLTRGKPAAKFPELNALGLIPAHAGKTRSPESAAPAVTAHPRSRGENAAHALAEIYARGSSPLTRGKLDERLHRRAPQGLIPAHAGKTWLHCFVRPGGWAHPRSRGENVSMAPLGVAAHPRSRGENIRQPFVDRPFLWLIPAHAGKTS